jgi:thioredoxin-like negative regulator of GroEL
MKIFPSILMLLLALSCPMRAQNAIDDLAARLEMARILRDSSKWDESIATYRKLLELDPSNRAAAGELVQVLVWTKQTKEAETLLAGIPEREWTPAAQAAAADLDIQAGRFDAAEKRLRSLLAIEPSDKLKLQLASVLSWKKQYPEAMEIFKALVEANPTDIQLRRKYAQVLGWAGRPDEAADQWKRSLDHVP